MTPRVALPGLLAAVAWALLPSAPVFGWLRGRPLPTPEAAALLAVLALAVALRPPAAVPWRGTARSLLVALPWTLLVAFEVARAVVLHTTNDDLPLYDALLLGKHLYVLARDLYGGLATAGLAAVALAPLAVLAVGQLLAGRVEAALAAVAPRWAGPVGVAAAAAAVAAAVPEGRWVTLRMRENATASWALYREVSTALRASGREALMDVAPAVTPDVRIYVIESYGSVVQTAEDYAPAWQDALARLEPRLAEAGWSMVAGSSAAPVHGGRSWIADATVAFGIRLAHQTSYEHAITFVDDLPHLPGWFARHGYTTVLVKPTDRERPGVRLENPFRYDRTVFFDDLGYRGPVVGWGVIPDQYTLGFVHDTVLPGIEPPTFTFFHLATSHLPWTEAPPILADWRDWQDAEGRQQRLFAERSVQSEVRLRVTRFKRWERDPEKGGKPVSDEQREQYLADVLYDLEVIGASLAGGVRRPTLVLIFGDHQPPLVAAGTGFEVPVHVLATDPALLAAFRASGFADGLEPPPGAAVAHEALFPLLVDALGAP